ncbi:MAG: DEAD/DEAH box helicase [Desulfobacterales bacterium]|nr:DEAD/DEAH box helicase [Desulfobacterales bacterium]
MKYKPGSLVTARNRDWVVLPSHDENLVLLKPLGGSEEEITGIYLPLAFPGDAIRSTTFTPPSKRDLGDIASARLLYNAARLSFRDGAGPFRTLARLSFRPRSYQMVPLIMALKQKGPVRLLIADDVGVGKTIEALLILKELLERREIKRFAVIAPPHLCEQWRAELRDKFGVEAVVIRSNTQARLDREIPGDASVFHHYSHQVISIDYIKSDQRRQLFVQECPEFVIVDEAHACIAAAGAGAARHQRHRLIRDIAAKPGRSMVYLTATPHSGKAEQFNALLGLIRPEFQSLDPANATPGQRKKLAAYYAQRRRADVAKWMNETTPFPKREAGEHRYELSEDYSDFYNDLLRFALGLTRKGGADETKKRWRYWSALALLRGVMSSPAAGAEMIKNRIRKAPGPDIENAGAAGEAAGEADDNPIMDGDSDAARDYTPTGVINKTDWSASESKKLNKLAGRLDGLHGVARDYKAARALEIIQAWLKEGVNPVVFCRFIRTANYLGEILREKLKKVDVRVATSEDPDEARKGRIEEMKASPGKVLVATDCLSEGINLQDQFTGVLHYDLPWNPNRLEQREGRIDRYGQRAASVKAWLLYGADNPIDAVVLKVLLRKVREIRRSTGIAIPFLEDSKSLLDSVLQAVITDARAPDRRRGARQLAFDFSDVDVVKKKEFEATRAIEKAADREKASRNIFAQHAIKAREIEKDLKQSDEAIGDPAAVEAFVVESLTTFYGVQITKNKKTGGRTLYTANLPPSLGSLLPGANRLEVAFHSPTPARCLYLGRNHLFVEQLCRLLMADAVSGETRHAPARASVIVCRDVEIKTTLLLFRVRNVIEERRKGGARFVAEEMLPWGYRGSPEDRDILTRKEVRRLMDAAAPAANRAPQANARSLAYELEEIEELAPLFDAIALERAEALVEAHDRFRKAMGSKGRHRAVKPVLPMDLLGVYILLPQKRK